MKDDTAPKIISRAAVSDVVVWSASIQAMTTNPRGVFRVLHLDAMLVVDVGIGGVASDEGRSVTRIRQAGRCHSGGNDAHSVFAWLAASRSPSRL
jgi:hypothetical protein